MPFNPFMDAKDVTARPVGDLIKNNLLIRILSALAMIPPVLAATYMGYPYFNLLIAIAVAAMAWEWRCMTQRGQFGYQGVILVAGLLGCIVAASIGAPIHAFLLVGLVAITFIAINATSRLTVETPSTSDIVNSRGALWMAAGAFYIGIPSVSLIWIRTDWDNGLLVVVWLLVLVWAADSGAYVAGRLIGGPKMAPKISPNKTWAGLGGCAVAAALSGVVVAHFAGLDGFLKPLLISALIGVISQGGDLVESGVKRHFKVKDSSNLIPGHGGVLDRVDALLAAVSAAALISLVSKGALMT